MRPGGGRAKGSAAERAVAKLVVDAFAKYGITKVDCFRTPGSGGHRFASKRDPGDLQLSPELVKLFPATVEVKHYAKLDWPKLLLPCKKKGKWSEWWTQVNHSQTPGRPPILVARQNGCEFFVVYKREDFKIPAIYPYTRTTINGDKVRVARFKKFLELMSRGR